MLTTAGRLAPRCYFMVWAVECSPVEEDVAEQLFCNYGAKTGETGDASGFKEERGALTSITGITDAIFRPFIFFFGHSLIRGFF